MAWCCSARASVAKSLSTHPCVFSCLWVNSSPPNAAYMRQLIGSALVHIMNWRQAIIFTNAGSLSNGHLGTKFSESLTKSQNFTFTKMYLKISSAKRRRFCRRQNELTYFDNLDVKRYIQECCSVQNSRHFFYKCVILTIVSTVVVTESVF